MVSAAESTRATTSLRAKFVWTTLAITLLVALSTLALVIRTSTNVSEEHLASVQGHIERSIRAKGHVLTENHARALTRLAEDNALSDMQELVRRATTEDEDVVYGLYLSEDGTPLAYAKGKQQAELADWTELRLPKEQLLVEKVTEQTRQLFGQRILEIAAPVMGEEELLGCVRYGFSTLRVARARADAEAAAAENLRRIILQLAGIVVAMILIGVAVSWRLTTRITKPVTELTQAANALADGNVDVRVAISSGDEIEILGSSFNHMTEEIARSRDALREKARMARELEIASTLQKSILPPKPTHAEFEFAGRMLPADEVGGDFYDVLTEPDGSALWLTVGDVSNHGLGAGLVMLMAQSAFASAFYLNPSASPDVVFRAVNALMQENVSRRFKDDKYATAQILVHQGSGVFRCAGGHEWPLVYRADTGETEVMEAPGPWLGIVPRLEDVPIALLTVAPGDILCLYSDGLIEARNAEGQLFDVDRLRGELRSAAGRFDSLEDVAEALIGAVEGFAVEREDDWTLLLVKRRSTKPQETGEVAV